jgi:geranylgeranyl diphosphate synthase, type II
VTYAGQQALGEYLEARRRDVDLALDRHLPAPPECPALIAEAMRYSVTAGGKRLRPVLVLAAAESVAGPGEGAAEAARALAMPAACALEFIHTYSLIHDDLPAMDNDALRRGRPTAHVVYGDGMAILAGDGLLTEAFALMAREPEGNDDALAGRKLRLIARVAEAAGAAGMVGGQTIDLLAVAPGAPPLDAAALLDMHARKTGALIRASAAAGAIMAGASDVQTAAIDRYAAEIGIAFQIVDDILDVEGDAGAIGKTPGKDAASGKPTYPALYGLEQSRRLAAECIERAEAALAGIGLDASCLARIGRWVVSRGN